MTATLPVICAWCESSHEVPAEVTAAPVTHGICEPCKAKAVELLEEEFLTTDYADNTDRKLIL